MHLSSAIATSLALASCAFAKGIHADGSKPSSVMPPTGTSGATPPVSSAMVPVHVINVSSMNGSLTYSPASTMIPKGHMVQFQFWPMNHSVVQAAFSNPCEPISDVMPNVTTFYTGYMPVKPTDMMRPAMTMMIKDDKTPFWYYCSQKDHCQKGMVGVINP